MPLSGLSVNNPQEQLSESQITPTVTGPSINYGGNVIGSGSTSTSQSTLPSNILIIGAIVLFVIFILQRIGEK